MPFLDNNPMSFIFGAKPGAGVPTYEQLQMRRKIVESLLGQKSRYPKTFGEGLGAIGEAIGERGLLAVKRIGGILHIKPDRMMGNILRAGR